MYINFLKIIKLLGKQAMFFKMRTLLKCVFNKNNSTDNKSHAHTKHGNAIGRDNIQANIICNIGRFPKINITKDVLTPPNYELSLVPNHEYTFITEHPSSLILPLYASINDKIIIEGMSNSNWKVLQRENQLIKYSDSSTTLGINGYLDCRQCGVIITLQCISTNTEWFLNVTGGGIQGF